MLFRVGEVRGQCPSTVPDYPAYPWNYGGCYNTIVGSCDVSICYCWRTIPGLVPRNDYIITSITPLDPDNCVVDWQTLVNVANTTLLYDNPKQFDCPPCPNEYATNFVTTQAMCWKLVQIGTTTGGRPIEQCQMCPGAYCKKGWAVCCYPDGSRHILGKIGPELIGEPCDDVAPFGLVGVAGSWPYGHCFLTVRCE